MKKETVRIISNNRISEKIYKDTVFTETRPEPGQFYMIKGEDGSYLLPRPISVNDYEEGKLSFVYRTEGKGTTEISRMLPASKIQIFGPLGNGYDLSQITGKTAVIGGGMGIIPLYYLAKNISKADIYLGYRDDTFCCEKFKSTNNNIIVTTEDGSFGEKGFVTDYVDYSRYDTVITCGPEIMMNKVIKEALSKNISVFASLERRMACGIGACLGCVVKTKNGNKRACKDGPVFSGKDLILE